jgi:uncharacterized membrane protein
MMKTDAEFVTLKILKLLKIKHTKNYVSTRLKNNNSFPSLASIKETLVEMNLTTIGYRINIENLSEYSYPLITQLVYPTKKFAIIFSLDQDNNEITYGLSDEVTIRESTSDFSDKWSQIVLSVEKTRQSIEKDFYKHYIISIKGYLLLLLSLAFFIYGFNENIAFHFWSSINVLILLNVLGLIVAWTIYFKESAPELNLFEKLCTVNSFFDCKKVMGSKQSLIFNTFSFSNMALGYFTFTAFLYLVDYNTSYFINTIKVQAILSLVGLPIIFYSLYSQAFVIKSFCLFCLTLVFIYCLETVLLVTHFSISIFKTIPILFPGFFFSAGLSLLSFLLISEFRTLIVEKNLTYDLNNEWFLSNPGVFKSILEDQKNIVTIKSDFERIKIGERSSLNKIMLIISSECIHCKSIANQFEQLIKSNHKSFELDIIFFASKKTSLILINVFLVLGPGEAWNAYLYLAKEGIENFNKNYVLKDELLEKTEQLYNAQQQFCQEIGVDYTPQVIVNGYQIPPVILNSEGFIGNLNKYLS